jgi:hypothetical protein
MNKRYGYSSAIFVPVLLQLTCTITHAQIAPRSAEELWADASSSYANQHFLPAAIYLYAYVQKPSRLLATDPNHRKQVEDAFAFSKRRLEEGLAERDRLKAKLEQMEAQAAGGVGQKVSGLGQQPPSLDAPHAGAGGDANRRCDVYSRIAVAQNEAAMAQNCGFSGPRWHSVKDHHVTWCMSPDIPPSFLDSETFERQRLLNECAP